MSRTPHAVLLVALALAAGADPARAQGRPLDDSELSATWGQALLDLTNTSLNGYDFSRITLNADINLSTTMTGLKLGTYDYNGVPGSDIDIARLSFGRSDAGDAKRTVLINNPYFEWVYSGTAGSADRQVIGMRLGFQGITGDVGMTMNSVSGALTMDTGNGIASLNGKRQDTLTCASGCTTVSLPSVGGVTTTGTSTDFFLSILKSGVTYPAVLPGGATAAQAQAGFWLNWTNNLKALNTTSLVPPNIPKTGP